MNTPVKPPRSILDPEFVYVPAEETNIAATFARVRSGLPYVEDDYADVERHHYMMFPGGFER